MKIKAHPTLYSGVKFRSRLEAKWAAFFDAAGIEWDYEPCDLEGWVPDFCLRVSGGPLYVEVKPVQLIERDCPHGWELPSDPSFQKAKEHGEDVWILLLGDRPQTDADYFGIGTLMDQPPQSKRFGGWSVMKDQISPTDSEAKWRAASNKVQWRPAL